jgi:hypothetical protein
MICWWTFPRQSSTTRRTWELHMTSCVSVRRNKRHHHQKASGRPQGIRLGVLQFRNCVQVAGGLFLPLPGRPGTLSANSALGMWASLALHARADRQDDLGAFFLE